MHEVRDAMNTTWLKIKMWTKTVVFGAVAVYVIAFVLLNRNAEITPSLDFIFHKYDHPNVLVVLLLTGVISVIGWWLIRTVFKTLRQLREVRRAAYLQRIEREHAEMKAKAAMLQTRPGTGEGVVGQ